MKTKIKLAITATVLAAVSALSTLTASAATTQDRDVYGGGSKYYNSAYVRTAWNGHLHSYSPTFTSDELTFTGSSNTRYDGYKQCDTVTHYDIIEAEGWGSPSFSGGVGATASGPTANFGISSASTDKNKTYAYTANRAWSCYVDYSYYAKIWSYSWMDLFTAGTCTFSNHNVVVNSRVDNPYVSRGTIYYS